MQDERRAISFQRPDFHFSETLSSELRLAAQRLLGDQRVRTDGTRVNLVVHQVRQLQHVDVAHGDRLFELLSSHAVVKSRLARSRQTGVFEQRLDLAFLGTVEHWRSHEHALGQGRGHGFQFLVTHVGNDVSQLRALEQRLQLAPDGFRPRVLLEQFRDPLAQHEASPSEMGFENLAHVHTAGYAERVEHDFHGRSVFEVRHILFRQNAGNDALVPVTAGHLVTDTQLALHGDVDLDQLDHARGQLVALGQFFFLLVDDLFEHVDLTRSHLFDLVDLLIHPRILVGILDALQVADRNALDLVASQDVALGQQALVGALVVQIGLHFLAAQDVLQALQALIGKNSDFVRKVLFQLGDLRGFDGLRALVLFLALAREDLHVDDHALDARWAVEGSIAHIAGLFTEDRTQQFFFRSELGFTLRRNLAHENVALLDAGADANHARFIQIAEHGFADVRNVARDFFRPQLGVASFDLVLLDVKRGVVILFHHLLGDEDRVFEVVTAPRHEGDQHVTSHRQFAVIGARTVSNDLSLEDPLASFHSRLLVDTSVLVRALELRELVDVAAHLTRQLRGMVFAFNAHDDALGVDRIDDAVTAGKDHGARVASGDAFHSRTHDRRLRAEQGHRL